MLSKAEKLAKCEEFIKETIGIDAFRTLYLFEENVTSLFSLIDLYGIIIAGDKKLQGTRSSFQIHFQIENFLRSDNF